MKPLLIDVHTHTQFSAYENDRDAVIRRALGARIWMINVGTQRDTSAYSCELAHRYEGVFATVGLHPIHTEKSYHDEKELGAFSNSQEFENGSGGFTSRGEEFDYDYYKKLAEDPKVVAIGECGLDYYRLAEDTKQKQAEVFTKQIELAHDIKKPLMIHCRNAFADLIRILKENLKTHPPRSAPLPKGGGEKEILSLSGGRLPGVCHFFTGTAEDASKLMDLGFSFSFGGVITFAREYEKLIKFIPLDRIVLETDAPYVAPQAYRGQRNEPLYVEEVAKKISRILNKDFDEIVEITTQNAKKIFGLN